VHKIYIAASASTVMVIFFYVSYILRISHRKDYTRLLAAFLLTIPLSPIANYALKPVLDTLVRLIVSNESGVYKLITTSYAPLVSEPIKLLPLLLPFVYHRINKDNFVSFGMALGVGFGIGEIWLNAFRSSQIPNDSFLPIGYVLLGYISEWLMISLLHGAFTSFALWRLRRGLGWGLGAAMGLHLLTQLPRNLFNMNIKGVNHQFLQFYMPFHLIFFFILMILLLIYLRAGKQGLQQIFSRAKIHCPECQKTYKRSYWMTHLSTKSIEQCPHCGCLNPIAFKEKP
jgi:hypothetical protein